MASRLRRRSPLPHRPRAMPQARAGTRLPVLRKRTLRTTTRSFPGRTRRSTPQSLRLRRRPSRRPLPAGPTMLPPATPQASRGTRRRRARRLQQTALPRPMASPTTASTRLLVSPEVVAVASAVDVVTAKVVADAVDAAVVAVVVPAEVAAMAKAVVAEAVAVALAAMATLPLVLRKPVEAASSALKRRFNRVRFSTCLYWEGYQQETVLRVLN
jgi:hypothetical protein